MKIVRTFVCKEQASLGEWGFSPAWMDFSEAENGGAYTSVAGFGAAHDMLEHRRHDKGSVADEFMAFGAMLLIRGKGHWFKARAPWRQDWADSIANEFSDIMQRVDSDTQKLAEPPIGSEIPLKDIWLEDQLRKAASLGRDRANAEFDMGHDLMSEEQEFMALRWMRHGLRAARRRYAKVDLGSVAACFDSITDRFDQAIRGRTFEEYDGDKVKVVADLHNGYARAIYIYT